MTRFGLFHCIRMVEQSGTIKAPQKANTHFEKIRNDEQRATTTFAQRRANANKSKNSSSFSSLHFNFSLRFISAHVV